MFLGCFAVGKAKKGKEKYIATIVLNVRNYWMLQHYIVTREMAHRLFWEPG
jgi:hypothetical protein